MLTINLLPESARKTPVSSVQQLHRIPLVWITFGLMIAVLLVLLLPISVNHQRSRLLSQKLAVLKPKQAEANRLQQLLRQLRIQEMALVGVDKENRHIWSKRLNTLSDLTPNGVWFNNLSLDQTKGLVIQGSAIGQGGEEMVSVGRLAQGLKGDSYFASACKDKEIQIESLKRIYDREVEIVKFTLTCTLANL